MIAQVISFHCVLKNNLGRVISSTFNHDVLTHSSSGDGMLEGLARGLEGIRKGEKRKICLSAQEAYGFYDPRKVIVRTRDEVPGRPQKGDQIAVQFDSGSRGFLRIEDISDESVILDGNHPLAGQDLIFEIEAIAAREATAMEIAESSAPSAARPKCELH